MTLYRVCRDVLVFLSRTIFRLQLVHGDRIPRTGAYVLAPSHRSYLDTPFVSAVTRRRIRFMGKRELWKHGWSARLFDALGAFPVDRDNPDRAALRTAMEALQGGEPLVVFPEGTRRFGPVITDLHDGAAYLAARAGVPIVPVGVGGSEEILPSGRSRLRLHRVAVVVGRPIVPPARDGRTRRRDVSEMTAALHAELQRCFDDARRLAGEEVRIAAAGGAE